MTRAGRSRETAYPIAMGEIEDILKLVKQDQYDTAIPRVEAAFRQAAAESPEKLKEAARAIVAYPGFFANNSQAEASVPYFRSVFATLEELAGPDSAAAMAAAENFAGILGSTGQLDEAIALRRRVLTHVRERYPIDDPRHMRIRDGMAFLYRRAGREAEAAALLETTGICEHLQRVERYLLSHGAKITYSGQPWSDHCHIWVYFDALFDCDRLIEALTWMLVSASTTIAERTTAASAGSNAQCITTASWALIHRRRPRQRNASTRRSTLVARDLRDNAVHRA